jgi:stress response protein SCP2
MALKDLMIILVFGMWCLSIAACGLNEQDPAAVSRVWLAAVLNGNGAEVARYTCQEQTRRGAGLASFLVSGLKGAASNLLSSIIGDAGKISFDIRDMTFTTVSSSESQAEVFANGTSSLIVGGGFKSGNTVMTLVLFMEDGHWKVCDIK